MAFGDIDGLWKIVFGKGVGGSERMNADIANKGENVDLELAFESIS